MEGAAFGALFAGFFLFVGVIRITLALISGRSIRMDGLAFGVLFYALSFAVAGAVIGILRPWARMAVSRYLLGVLGATIAATLMMGGVAGAPHRWGAVEYAFIAVVGTVFGLMLGRSL